MIALAVISTDGRRHITEDGIRSVDRAASASGLVSRRVIFTDDDRRYVEWLYKTFPAFEVVTCGPRAGYAAAFHAAFARLATGTEQFAFVAEDDFTFPRPLELVAMSTTLRNNPQLAQLALRRQPWNDTERAAGGIVEQHPDWYEQRHGPQGEWLEHTAFWTNGASLIPRWVFNTPYPTGKDAEGMFGFALKDAHDGVRFGFWGSFASGEACRHIGDVGVRGAF
jgi:hypothetical protein